MHLFTLFYLQLDNLYFKYHKKLLYYQIYQLNSYLLIILITFIVPIHIKFINFDDLFSLNDEINLNHQEIFYEDRNYVDQDDLKPFLMVFLKLKLEKLFVLKFIFISLFLIQSVYLKLS